MRQIKYFQAGKDIVAPATDGSNVLDFSDLRLGLFNRRKKLQYFRDNGYLYQGQNGNLYRFNDAFQTDDQGKPTDTGYTDEDWFNKIREERRNQRYARKYGISTPEGWTDEQANIRKKMLTTNNPYIKVTPKSKVETSEEKRTYNYSFDNSDSYTPVYKALLESLYANERYNTLNDLLGTDRNFTNVGIQNYLANQGYSDNFNGYLQSLAANDLTSDQIKAISDLYKPGTVNPTLPTDLPAISENVDNWDKIKWGARGITNPARARAVQTAFGLKHIDNYWAPGGETDKLFVDPTGALYGKSLSKDNFVGDFFVIQDANGTKYYAGSDGKVYDAQGNVVSSYKYQSDKYTFKKGGKMKYFQMGGQINQQQINRDNTAKQREVLKSAFETAATGDMEALSKILGITTQEQLNNFITLTSKISKQKDADPEMAELASKALNGIQQALSVKAEQGAKLEYFKRLSGKCPEGYEMKMFKIGGKVCKKCQKIEEACKGKKMENGGESPLVTKFKNGRKCKK